MKDLKIFTENIEQEALLQIETLLEQEAFKEAKVRIMPDVHAGNGCVIGFTANLGNKVVPNLVGVDIGCGMLTVKLGNIEIDLAKIDQIIKEEVPYGFNVHKERKVKFDKLQELKCYRELKDTKRLERSIGSLGGGNHFIEIDTDVDNNKYLIIHTGSRNLGKQVAEYYQDLANQLCNYNKNEYLENKNELINFYKKQGRQNEIQKALIELEDKYKINTNKIPNELAYLEGKYRDDYLFDMKICQEFAQINRFTIAKNIVENCFDKYKDYSIFETVHNYISFNDNIIRKGAISAKKDELVLIPLNMRDGCILALGLGNEDWNCSAPHGAGRIMSRTRAKKELSYEDFKNSMLGIYTTTATEDTLDESPFVYKPKQEIIDNIKDTVEIIKILKPIYNFKASE